MPNLARRNSSSVKGVAQMAGFEDIVRGTVGHSEGRIQSGEESCVLSRDQHSPRVNQQSGRTVANAPSFGICPEHNFSTPPFECCSIKWHHVLVFQQIFHLCRCTPAMIIRFVRCRQLSRRDHFEKDGDLGVWAEHLCAPEWPEGGADARLVRRNLASAHNHLAQVEASFRAKLILRSLKEARPACYFALWNLPTVRGRILWRTATALEQ